MPTVGGAAPSISFGSRGGGGFLVGVSIMTPRNVAVRVAPSGPVATTSKSILDPTSNPFGGQRINVKPPSFVYPKPIGGKVPKDRHLAVKRQRGWLPRNRDG